MRCSLMKWIHHRIHLHAPGFRGNRILMLQMSCHHEYCRHGAKQKELHLSLYLLIKTMHVPSFICAMCYVNIHSSDFSCDEINDRFLTMSSSTPIRYIIVVQVSWFEELPHLTVGS